MTSSACVACTAAAVSLVAFQQQALAEMPVVLPDGTVVMSYTDARYFTGRVPRSADGGSTFSGVKEIARVPPCADGTFVASTGGDYFGLARLPENGFRIVWSETPAGTSRLMSAVVHIH